MRDLLRDGGGSGDDGGGGGAEDEARSTGGEGECEEVGETSEVRSEGAEAGGEVDGPGGVDD